VKDYRRLAFIIAAGSIFLGVFSRDLMHGFSQAKTGAAAQRTAEQKPDDEAWPRQIKSGNTTFVVHQPQLDSWDGRNVEVLAAVEVKAEGQEKALYGAARLTASVNIDKSARMAEFVDVKVTKAVFPASPGNEEEYLRILQNSVMQKVRQISLDRFETALTVMEAEHKFTALPLKNDPPAIIHSKVPAILVYVDGPPTYRPIEGLGLARVINTRPLILKDTEGKFFLHLFDGWMESKAFNGPWEVCKKPSSMLSNAMKDAIESGQVDLLEGKADPESNLKPPSLSNKPVPVIYIVTTPTELIVTEGSPKFVSIPGTSLAYAENTTGNVFKDTRENKLYILVSGRWFRSATTNGPWEFVPGGKLPSDFSKIPDDNPKENAKASVPGTQQALEAVIAAHIPQTATVSRNDIKINPPQFDGEPQFKPLEGTPLQYVVNTGTPIIHSGANEFYAVENGVWFKAESVKGPWIVADYVPGVIYTIPPSAPLHYVTYVKIYGSTATTVDVGYTPGYYGTVVTKGSGYIVMYGTGYAYTPWVGTTWFGPPVTYGCGSSITYTPWDGWAVSFGFGWSWGYPMYPMGWGWGPYPWWGPVGWGYYYPYPYYAPVYGGVAWGPNGAVAWGPGGWAATTGNVYGRYGNTGAVTRTSQGFNAWTGNQWANKVGMSYNSRNGNIAAGQRAGVHNVYTGDYAYGSRGVVTSGTTGKTYTGGRITAGNTNTGQSGSAGYVRGESGGVARVGDNVYAAKDGTVYRREAGGWEQNSGSGWNQVEAPSSSTAGQNRAQAARDSATQRGMQQNRSAADQSPQLQPRQTLSNSQMQSLNRQWDARSMGQTRTMSNRNFSGGGMRMGGARR
jgi:hypothetical protein